MARTGCPPPSPFEPGLSYPPLTGSKREIVETNRQRPTIAQIHPIFSTGIILGSRKQVLCVSYLVA
jgi:hypothetical protein